MRWDHRLKIRLDGFFRMGEGHSINTMLTHTYSTTSGKSGLAGAAQYYYSTNNQWKIWWTEALVTKDFKPELGFVSRTDVIATTPGIILFLSWKGTPV